MVTFGERLARLREDKDMNQKELAEALGVTRGAVSMWEIGQRTPDSSTLQKIASFFNVSIDYLLGLTDDPTPPQQKHDPSTPSCPSWWFRDTPPTDVELEEFLKTANIHFMGAPLDEDDKEDILTYLRVKWEREKRKRANRSR